MGESRIIYGLVFDFTLLGAHIRKVHKENGVVEGYFHVVPLNSKLRFPFLGVILGVLNDYGIATSQLALNFGCIIAYIYLGCKAMMVFLTLRLFRMFYSMKMREEFYYL